MIWIGIQWIFSLKIVKFCVNFASFLFEMLFCFLLFSIRRFVDLLLQHRVTSFSSTAFRRFRWVEIKRSFDRFFFSDKTVRKKKNRVCFCFLRRRNVPLFNRVFCERFSHWILVEDRWIERFVFVLEELFRVKLSRSDFPLSIKLCANLHEICLLFELAAEQSDRTSMGFFTWREQTNIFCQSNVERWSQWEFHFRFLICEQMFYWAGLSRRFTGENQFNETFSQTINNFLHQTDFSSNKIPVAMVRCSTWIKSGESQSIVGFYSLN